MLCDQLHRREFITVLGGTAVWPLAARAEGEKRYTLGTLSAGAGAVADAGFFDALREFG